nr:MAG TPA: hypothetical protein [Caudoviricetes sp.]
MQRLLAVCRSGRTAGDGGRRCVGRRNAGRNAGHGDCGDSGWARPPALRSRPGRASLRMAWGRPPGRAGPGGGWIGVPGRLGRRRSGSRPRCGGSLSCSCLYCMPSYVGSASPRARRLSDSGHCTEAGGGGRRADTSNGGPAEAGARERRGPGRPVRPVRPGRPHTARGSPHRAAGAPHRTALRS